MTNCIKGPQTMITITIIKTHQRSRDRHNCSGCCSKCHHWSFCSCSWAVQVVFWFYIVTQLWQFVCIFYFYKWAVQVVFHHPPILMYTLINGSIHQAWLLHNQQPRRSSSASYMWNYAGDKKTGNERNNDDDDDDDDDDEAFCYEAETFFGQCP